MGRSMQFQLFLVRHGETNFNKLRIVQGHLDTPLNETGEIQAVTLGKHLCDAKFTFTFSSDLQRARTTCELLLSKNLKFLIENKDISPIQLDARLRERKFGCMEGKPSGDFKMFNVSSKSSHKAGGEFVPEGGESLNDLKERAKSFFLSLCEKISEEFSAGNFENEDITVLLVSHGGFIKALFSLWTENYNISSNGLKNNFHKCIVGNASHSGVIVKIILPQNDDIKPLSTFSVDAVNCIYYNSRPTLDSKS